MYMEWTLDIHIHTQMLVHTRADPQNCLGGGGATSKKCPFIFMYCHRLHAGIMLKISLLCVFVCGGGMAQSPPP